MPMNHSTFHTSASVWALGSVMVEAADCSAAIVAESASDDEQSPVGEALSWRCHFQAHFYPSIAFDKCAFFTWWNVWNVLISQDPCFFMKVNGEGHRCTQGLWQSLSGTMACIQLWHSRMSSLMD